jgi:hypothetical protein
MATSLSSIIQGNFVGAQGPPGLVEGSANQILYKDGSNVAVTTSSLTYTNTGSGIKVLHVVDGRVGIGTTFFNSSIPRVPLEIYGPTSISLLGVGTPGPLFGDRITIANEDNPIDDQVVLGFYNFNSSTNNKRWITGVKGENFILQALDDSSPGSGGGNLISIGRSDEQLSSLELQNGTERFLIADFNYQKIGIGSGIGIGTTGLPGCINIGGYDGNNVYFDVRNVPERQIIFDTGDTYAYYFGGSNTSVGISTRFGFLDSTNNRNIWYYVVNTNTLHLGPGSTSGYLVIGNDEVIKPKVGIGSTSPVYDIDVRGDFYADRYIFGSGTSSTVDETTMAIDASTIQRHCRIVNFTAGTKTFQISNLTPGREVKIYVRNTRSASRTIEVTASTTTTGFSAVNLSASGAASVTGVTLASSSGTAVIWVANIAGEIVGSLT